MQVMAREAAFSLHCLSVKSCKKAGVLGLPLTFPGDDMIVARVPANIKVVGRDERLRVAKIAGNLLVFFRFRLQAIGLALIVSGEVRMIAGGAGICYQLAKVPAKTEGSVTRIWIAGPSRVRMRVC